MSEGTEITKEARVHFLASVYQMMPNASAEMMAISEIISKLGDAQRIDLPRAVVKVGKFRFAFEGDRMVLAGRFRASELYRPKESTE